jgi:hypothetical protein
VGFCGSYVQLLLSVSVLGSSFRLSWVALGIRQVTHKQRGENEGLGNSQKSEFSILQFHLTISEVFFHRTYAFPSITGITGIAVLGGVREVAKAG